MVLGQNVEKKFKIDISGVEFIYILKERETQ